ncbi:MAG: mercury resistance system transport protein MerF [Thermohalobaculum sp.]|nr:mercury resistance system transport protein MerF [Thermohalobaculum sp.]
MWRDRLFRVGAIGSIVTAICCVTPVLVWALAAFGVIGAVVWLDFLLFPMLGLFLAVTIYAAMRRRHE